jgi:hypothetical protein
VNQGGEPGHDDYGLPPIDIEIPDDARELDRDVQAYHRELRALRRHQRSRRWRAPLQRSSVLMPLVAGCLLVAMLSGMVLTMFSANSYISGLTNQSQGAGSADHGARTNRGSAAPHVSASGRTSRGPFARGSTPSGSGLRAGAPLPDRTIKVAGKLVALRTLTSSALAIIPATCQCAVALRQLLAQAKQARVPVYLVSSRANIAAIATLARSAQPGASLLATDPGNVLAAAYHPVGLTVLLVDRRGVVTVASGLLPGLRLTSQLTGLNSPAG